MRLPKTVGGMLALLMAVGLILDGIAVILAFAIGAELAGALS